MILLETPGLLNGSSHLHIRRQLISAIYRIAKHFYKCTTITGLVLVKGTDTREDLLFHLSSHGHSCRLNIPDLTTFHTGKKEKKDQ